MKSRLSAIERITPQLIAMASLTVATAGTSFVEVTDDVNRFLAQAEAGEGALFAYLRHTSASLVIQENADPDVQRDLNIALARIAPANAGWVHDAEGPDDMPAHIKTMLTGVSLHIPIRDGKLALGTWQGLYLAEHRAQPHQREIVLQFIGSRR